MTNPIDTRPKSLFGIWLQSQTSVDLLERSYGNVDRTMLNDYLVGSNRNGKSSNRRRMLSGTSTPWISPSSYNRVVNTYQHLQQGFARVIKTSSPSLTYSRKFDVNFQRAEAAMPGSFAGFPKGYGAVVQPESNLMNRLEVEALLEIRDGKAELGSALAEARKTYGMFAQYASKLYNFFLAVRHRQWSRARRVLGLTRSQLRRTRWTRTAGGRYLEYIYGWRPLIQDIHGTYELLTEQLRPALLIKGKRTFSHDDTQEFGPFNDVSNQLYHTIRQQSIRHYTVFLVGRCVNPYSRDVERAGLTNPLAIAWEVTPYSFLVDWAVPIGNVLEALQASAGLSFVGGYKSVRGNCTKVYTTTIRPSENAPPASIVEKSTPALGIRFTGSLDRQAYGTFPFPLPYVVSPFEGHKDSRVLAALALLAQIRAR